MSCYSTDVSSVEEVGLNNSVLYSNCRWSYIVARMLLVGYHSLENVDSLKGDMQRERNASQVCVERVYLLCMDILMISLLP